MAGGFQTVEVEKGLPGADPKGAEKAANAEKGEEAVEPGGTSTGGLIGLAERYLPGEFEPSCDRQHRIHSAT